MINRLDRYIIRNVLGATLVVLLIMVMLDSFFNLLGELEDIGEGNYGVLQVLQFLLLTLPRRIYDTLPVALLVGGLLGMGALATHSELTIMRGTGRSLPRLVFAAMQAGFLLSLGVLLLGEFVAPITERMAQEWRLTAKSTAANIHYGRGFWARDGHNIINVNAALPGARLIDINIYSLDEHSDLTAVVHADSASYRAGQWLMEGVRRSVIQPEAVTTDALPTIAWESVITPETLAVLTAKPDDLALRDLSTYIDYLRDNALDTRVYELAFWTKLIAPLANLAMLYIAMPFAFGAQRSAAVGQRLFFGILLGLMFFLLNRLLGNLVLLYSYPPLLGAALPMLLFYSAGTIALRRLR